MRFRGEEPSCCGSCLTAGTAAAGPTLEGLLLELELDGTATACDTPTRTRFGLGSSPSGFELGNEVEAVAEKEAGEAAPVLIIVPMSCRFD